jgi:hypothetical protein
MLFSLEVSKHHPTKGEVNLVTVLNLSFICYIDLIPILPVLKSDLYLKLITEPLTSVACHVYCNS